MSDFLFPQEVAGNGPKELGSESKLDEQFSPGSAERASIASLEERCSFVEAPAALTREQKWEGMMEHGLQEYSQEYPRHFRRRVRRGVPGKYRWDFWKAMADSSFGERGPPLFKYPELSRRETKWTPEVRVDIRWLFADQDDFGEAAREQVQRILNAYAAFNSSLGYRRGMNVLAGLLFQVADDGLPEEVEEQVFTVLISSLEVFGLAGVFEPEQPLLRDLLEVADELVQEMVPDVWQHFRDEQLDISVYLYPWFQSLFIGCLPLPMVSAMWDCMFCEGALELVRCAIALIKLLKDVLLCMHTDELVSFFLEITTHCAIGTSTDAEQAAQLLLKTAKDIAIPSKYSQEVSAPGMDGDTAAVWFQLVAPSSNKPPSYYSKKTSTDAEVQVIYQLSRYFAQHPGRRTSNLGFPRPAPEQEASSKPMGTTGAEGASSDDDDDDESGKEAENTESPYLLTSFGHAGARGSTPRHVEVARSFRYMAQMAQSDLQSTTVAMQSILKGLLSDADSEIRWAAMFALGALDTDTIEANLQLLLNRMQDNDEHVRQAAVNALSKLEPKALAEHTGVLLEKLQDGEAGVRRDVLNAMATLPPQTLAMHAATLTQVYREDPDWEVKLAVAQMLSTLDASTLGGQMSAIVQHFDEQVEAGDSDCVDLLAPLLALRAQNTLLHCAARAGCSGLAAALLRQHKAALLHIRNELGCTPLHVAAEHGHRRICQMLVDAGALIKAKDMKKQTPADLAHFHQHSTVVDFLESRKNLTTVRGGVGDAFADAMADPRQVIKLEWYTIPLPGLLANLGAVHSLLAITVGAPQCPSHTYVVEKAARIRAEGDDLEQNNYLNGVHISHWVDVAPNVDSDPIHILNSSEITNNTGKPELRMSVLRDMAVEIGPYDVAGCNCHHASLVVYNASAVKEARIPFIPNYILTGFALALKNVGIDVVGSNVGSGSLSSASTSMSSASAISRPSAALPGLPELPADAIIGAGTSEQASPQSKLALNVESGKGAHGT